MDNSYSYGMNLLISIDQLANAALGGSCDETLSSRAYRMARLGKPGWVTFEDLVDRLFWFDKGWYGERHCELAYMVEMRRGHMPKSMVRASLVH